MVKSEPGNRHPPSPFAVLASNSQKKHRLVPNAARPGLRLSHDVDDNKWFNILAGLDIGDSPFGPLTHGTLPIAELGAGATAESKPALHRACQRDSYQKRRTSAER